MYYTKFRLSSHTFLVERAGWSKDKILYHETTCSLCNIHDVQDEYHIAMICKYFKEVREKYDKQYYYNRPSMMKLNCSGLCCFSKLLLNCMLKLSNCITNSDD